MFQRLNALEAKRYIMENPNATILDFRDKEFFDEDHFDNAIFMQLEMLDRYISNASIQDKSKEVLVICGAGVRSPKASQILVENGFEKVLCSMEGYRIIKSVQNN